MHTLGNILPLRTSFVGGEVVPIVIPMSARVAAGIIIHHAVRAAGESLGSEMLVNGGFDADTDWTKGSGVTIPGDGTLTFVTGAATIAAQQDASLVAGTTYRTTLVISAYTSSDVRVRCGNSGTTGTLRTATGTFVEDLLCGGNGIFYVLNPNDFVGKIDSVSCKAITSAATPQGWELAIFCGQSVDGPWDDSPEFGPIRISSGEYATTTLNGAAAIGDEVITVADDSGLQVGRPILLGAGTAGQQVRTPLAIASNDVLLDARLTAPLADLVDVFSLQSTYVPLPQRIAPAYRVELTNLDQSAIDAALMINAAVNDGVRLA